MMVSEPKGPLVPERLSKQRKALGWTQAKLAQMLGDSSAASITRWERGTRVPSHKIVRRLARLLGVPVDYLTGHMDLPVSDQEPGDEELKVTTGKRLSGLRECFGLIIEQVSAAVGADLSTVGNWETGRFGASVQSLIRVAQFYGCSTDYLLGLTDNPLGPAASDALPIEALPVTQNPHFLQATTDHVTRQMLTRPDTYLILRALALGLDIDSKTLETTEHLLRAIRSVRSPKDTPS